VPAPPPVERLIASLRRLPGIGEKSATRLAFFLLSAPDDRVQELADAIARLKKEVVLCEECFDLTGASPCSLCRDPKRDATAVCVVEEPADRAAVDRSGSYAGLYHVLGGALSPIDGIDPDDLRISELVSRVSEGEAEEVVIATNPTTTGEATAHHLAELLRGRVTITRLASGLPVGADLEHADEVTLGRALSGRRSLD
jgi:recombination protein RecR